MKYKTFALLIILLSFFCSSSFGELEIIKSELVQGYEGEDITDYCSLGCAMGWDLESSSNLSNQGNNSYDVSKLTDGSPKTAWVEGSSGDGVGENILFKFPKIRFTESGIDAKINLNGFYILTGYAKDETTWKNNSREKKIEIYHNNKSVCIVDLLDSMKLQEISFDTVWLHPGDSIKVVILKVYKGIKYDDTAISILEPLGTH